ncbi:MAG: alginate export family protein [Paludibacter sp.]|nr:alginate export family protein [Paludibacter sp.]
MKKIISSIILLLTVFCVENLFAQTISIDGEIRPRMEYRDGYAKPLLSTNNAGAFTSQRTRLGFGYKSALLTTQITLQDARIFGQYSSSSTEASTSIYEAWAEMLFAPGASLKIGRQCIKYDDNRMFSSPTWNLSGTAHDLILFKYSINDYQAHIALAYNNNSEISSETYYTSDNKYRSLAYAWLTTPNYKGFTLSGMFVAEGVQDTTGVGTAYSKTDLKQALTFGGNLKFENNETPFSGLATAYFQAGKSSTGKTMDGKLLALKACYAMNKAVSLNLGTDYISGDKNGTTDGIQSNFKKHYGANHNFNGYMDYWNSPLTQGLLDYYASATAKVNKVIDLEGAYHVFNAEYAGKNKKGIAFEKDLGSEMDLLLTYNMNKITCIQAGYCCYFANNNTLIAKDLVSSTTIPDSRFAQWGYIMISFKPTFL